MVLIFMILFYLLLMGFVTVLESKVMGLVQLSLSVFSCLFFGIYQFYLDFFKLLLKGILCNCFGKMFYYNLLLGMFFFNNILIFLLLLSASCLNCLVLYDIFLVLLLEGNVLFFKMCVFYLMSNKFVSYNDNSFKSMMIFLEGVYVYLVILIMFFKSVVGCYGFNLFIIVLVLLLSLVSLVKMFSTPFDYLETESELVNGISLEFYGYSFLLWSLVEYSSIFNNVFFMSVLLVLIIFCKSLFLVTLMNVLFLFMVLFMSSVFISASIESSVYFVILVYCFFNFLLFMFLLI